MNMIPENSPETFSRRTLLSRGTLLAGAVAVGGSLHSVSAQETTGATTPLTSAPAAAAPDDLTILNLALGLELLGQAFYNRVVESDTSRKYLQGRLGEVARAIRDNETAHVQTLSDAVRAGGGTPVTARSYVFPDAAFVSPVFFAQFAAAMEEIEAGAYLGAIGQIKSRDLRRTAASIYGIETRHVGLLRHLSGHSFAPRYYEGSLSITQVQSLIAPYISA